MRYRLAVGTLDIQTSGLGGGAAKSSWMAGADSPIGPKRVIPISYVAWRETFIKDEVKSWAEGQDLHVDAGLLPPIAAYTYLEGNQRNGALSSLEERILDFLPGKSASVFRIADYLQYPCPSLLESAGELEERGLIHRSWPPRQRTS